MDDNIKLFKLYVHKEESEDELPDIDIEFYHDVILKEGSLCSPDPMKFPRINILFSESTIKYNENKKYMLMSHIFLNAAIIFKMNIKKDEQILPIHFRVSNDTILCRCDLGFPYPIILEKPTIGRYEIVMNKQNKISFKLIK